MNYKSSRMRKTEPIHAPCRKAIYKSLIEANESIDYLQKKKWVKGLSAYKCSVCGFWHLTSK